MKYLKIIRCVFDICILSRIFLPMVQLCSLGVSGRRERKNRIYTQWPFCKMKNSVSIYIEYKFLLSYPYYIWKLLEPSPKIYGVPFLNAIPAKPKQQNFGHWSLCLFLDYLWSERFVVLFLPRFRRRRALYSSGKVKKYIYLCSESKIYKKGQILFRVCL